MAVLANVMELILLLVQLFVKQVEAKVLLPLMVQVVQVVPLFMELAAPVAPVVPTVHPERAVIMALAVQPTMQTAAVVVEVVV